MKTEDYVGFRTRLADKLSEYEKRDFENDIMWKMFEAGFTIKEISDAFTARQMRAPLRIGPTYRHRIAQRDVRFRIFRGSCNATNMNKLINDLMNTENES